MLVGEEAGASDLEESEEDSRAAGEDADAGGAVSVKAPYSRREFGADVGNEVRIVWRPLELFDVVRVIAGVPHASEVGNVRVAGGFELVLGLLHQKRGL